jgi:hypothetical protein
MQVARHCLIGLGLFLAPLACVGVVGPAAGTPASPEPGGGRTAADEAATSGGGAMPMRLQRLTRDQYGHTLRDLLGDDTHPGDDLPFDATGDSGFFQPGNVGQLEARRFMEAAEAAAARAVADLPRLLGCDPGHDGCVSGFLQRFGRRAFRRPLAPEESAGLEAQYASARARPGADASTALRATIAAVLQAPSFLYRWELGARPAAARPDGVVMLTPHELASRLSYFLWGSMPDEPLFAAADAGTLAQPAELAAQARRLLASPRARDAVISFHEQWLDLSQVSSAEKDPTIYKGFDESVRAAMLAETRAFVTHVVLDGDGKLDTLMGASFSFLNDKLAKLYGVAGVTGADLRRQPLDPAQRFGLLTQGSFLATHAHPYDSAPVKRGLMVRERLLCQPVPPPPPDVVAQPPQPDPKVPVREQFVMHSAVPACRGCHQQIDPLGFAFESYDGVGRYRTVSGGKPVDASGVLTGLASGDSPFASPRELVDAVRASAEHRRCVAAQWLRHAIGRKDGAGDAASLDAAQDALARSGGDLRELLVAVATGTSFRFRTPSVGEVLQ